MKKIRKKRDKSIPSGSKFAKGIVAVEDTDDNLVMLVYGQSGRGKTYFASTFPKPVLVIDVNERGTNTIKGIPGVDVRRITNWDEFEAGYWYLEGGTKYKSVIIDQITNLQDLGINEIRRRAKKGPTELISKKNWGELGGLMKQWIDNYRLLKDQYNILFIAHERIFSGGDEEEEEGVIDPDVGARVTPSTKSFLDGAMDAIGSCFIKESVIKKKGGKKERRVDYCMRVGPHAYYITKIRRPPSAGPLPAFIVNPTYQKIRDLEAGKPIAAKKKVTKKVRRK